ncbi:MAG: Omp28-related outer membrane protein, partial [Bacteroidia bacterium]|nr:Omp28-related outer membrane protein [Bacteroidia bacterium]
MKIFTSVLASLLIVFSGLYIQAQTLVSTSPGPKNAVIEEFTGCSCPACPGGHTNLENIQAANPNRAIVIAMHPTNSSLTGPHSGSPDFRRSFCNAFYTTPYYGSSRSMPSAHINRRIWGAERKLSSGSWSPNTTTIVGEASPVNIGMSSTYSQLNDEINVTVEIYFTSDVLDPTTLSVFITEDGLIGGQSGSSNPNYVHDHVFRESLTAQWGDAVTGATTAGSLVTMNFTYDNSSTNYDIDNCHVVAFISRDYNASPGNNEIFTGVEIAAKNGSTT